MSETLELILLTVAFLLAGGSVTFKHRGRLAELEVIDREARTNHAAERAELARLRDDVEARIAEVERREDACARLAESTAQLRQALYKQTKGINRSVAQWAHEARAETSAALAEAARVNADAKAQRETIATVVGDPRVARLLGERVLPTIPEEGLNATEAGS